MAHCVSVLRDGRHPLEVSSVELTTVDFGLPAGLPSGAYRLFYPTGWSVEQVGPLRWRVSPESVDVDRPQQFRLVSMSGQLVDVTASVQVNLDLRSALDVASVALPQRNRASELGEVEPDRNVFDETFSLMPEPLRRLLFAGMYSDIVFLHAEGRKGGLCSGMARWTLARALGDEPAPASLAEAVERIRRFHGRQMKDRALFAAIPWFLRGSPNAAFKAVRDDLMERGVTDRALDLAVPKLWRRDLARALVQEGHTVVPYRLRQEGPERGFIEVYDPNHPGVLNDPSREPRTIHFDLKRDRYWYGTLVEEGQSNVGMIAVRQPVYEGPGTALLATAGSLLFTPKRGWLALLGRLNVTRRR